MSLSTTTQPLVTIDAESTRDIDDAFSIRGLPDGQLELLVAIADPSGAVPVGSVIDAEAQSLAATIYARDRAVKRMLPQTLSEHGCSLVQGQARDALLIRLVLDSAGATVQDPALAFGKIVVTHRLSYGEIPSLMRGEEGPLKDMLAMTSVVATQLFDTRVNRGSLALFDPVSMVMTDEEGRLVRMPSADAMMGHLIIQELMILANSQLAEYMARRSIAGVYRNHEPLLSAPPAGELAQSLRAWLQTGAADGTAFNKRVGLAVGRACYGPSLKAHYGLSLPAYAHVTSPLRRYADLINLRQLKAHVLGKEAPYRQGDLVELCERINTTLSNRKDDTESWHKEKLRGETEITLQGTTLQGAQDHVLVQAIKLMRSTGQVQAILRDELIERMKNSTISDKVVDGLVSELPVAIWPGELALAFVDWMSHGASRVMHVLAYARQTGVLQTMDLQASGEGTAFEAVCRISRDGNPFTGRGSGTRKRDAEQGAALDALSKMLGCPTPPQRWVEATTSKEMSTNPKGALLELCQARGWTFPSFKHSSSGPSHAPYFSVTVQVATPEGAFDAESTATSKKQAEANACAELLPQLQARYGTIGKDDAPPVANPVGELQERAQQGRFKVPEYAINTKQSNPPIFEAEVTVFEGPTPQKFSGFASSKSEAKRNAASNAMVTLNGGRAA